MSLFGIRSKSWIASGVALAIAAATTVVVVRRRRQRRQVAVTQSERARALMHKVLGVAHRFTISTPEGATVCPPFPPANGEHKKEFPTVLLALVHSQSDSIALPEVLVGHKFAVYVTTNGDQGDAHRSPFHEALRDVRCEIEVCGITQPGGDADVELSFVLGGACYRVSEDADFSPKLGLCQQLAGSGSPTRFGLEALKKL